MAVFLAMLYVYCVPMSYETQDYVYYLICNERKDVSTRCYVNQYPYQLHYSVFGLERRISFNALCCLVQL